MQALLYLPLWTKAQLDLWLIREYGRYLLPMESQFRSILVFSFDSESIPVHFWQTCSPLTWQVGPCGPLHTTHKPWGARNNARFHFSKNDLLSPSHLCHVGIVHIWCSLIGYCLPRQPVKCVTMAAVLELSMTILIFLDPPFPPPHTFGLRAYLPHP